MANETVLITGASSGIGLELARLFAAEGSNLVLVARSEDKLLQLADELRATHSIETHVLPYDLADHGSPQRIYDQLQEQGIEIDVLVNNAGFGALGTVANLPVQRQVDMIQVNVEALVHLTCLFLPGMKKRNRGGVLNIGSTASFQPGPNGACYFASKAFVLSFTEALHEEMRLTDVNVCCLSPGAVETNFGEVSRMEKTWIFRLGTLDVKRVAKAGVRGLRKNRAIVIPGMKNKLTAFIVRFVPRATVRRVVLWMQPLT